jgi:hypothetical protein
MKTLPPVEYSTDILQSEGRLIAVCTIEHFAHSGVSVEALFAKLRPAFESAIEDAAARDPAPALLKETLSVRVDVGVSDPGLELWVYSPAAAMVDLAACLGRIEAGLTSFVAGHRIGGAQ